MVRAQIGRIGANLWLDGLVGALASAAITRALLLGPVTAGAEGSSVAVLTSLACPIGDLLLVAVVVTGVLMSGWRPTGPSAAGFVSFGVTLLAVDRFIHLNALTVELAAATLLARALALRSAAEGIEDGETLELLAAMDCDAGQGFHIARPMPGRDLLRWADGWTRTHAAHGART